MKVLINKELRNIFLSSHKNHNHSLNFFLNSIDLNTCSKCMKLVKQFELLGNRVEVEIDDSNIKIIKKIFCNTENAFIEQLLWIAIFLPEV